MSAAAADLADPQRPELRSRVLAGFVWKIASQGVTQILNTVVIIVLARLLTPREFGIAAMAEVAGAFVVTYSDCGLGLALVQKETITEADRSTVFWASTALGLLMTAVCVALAPLVADYYHTHEVVPLLDVLSISFFFTGLASTHRSLYLRAMNFRVLEIRTMASGVAGAIVTLILALLGYGAWAIIIGGVAATAASTVLLLLLGDWRPHFIFSRDSLRELGSFGLRYLGGTTFLTLNANADNILVGGVLGGAALGTYSLAYSVILVPLGRLALPIHQLLSPAFARLQTDTQALAASWLRATRLLLMIFLPLMLTVSVTAPDVVHILFGSKWNSAIPVIRILAPICAILSLQGIADAVIQAVGAMRTYLRMSGVSFAFNITAFIIGIQWGLVGLSLATGISVLSFMILYYILVSRTIGRPARAFVRPVLGILMASVALVVVELIVYAGLTQTDIGAVLRVAATTITGLGMFGLVLMWRDRDALLDLGRLATEKLPGSRRFLPQALQSA